MKNNYRKNIGSVSEGTLRAEDLHSAFISELESQKPLRKEHRKLLREIQERLDAAEILGVNYFEILEGEQASEDLEELENALSDYCLPYFYFGAQSGDGACFGFWLSESFPEEFEGLKVSDTSEVPTGYTGEVLHINDHGNCTLYACTRGRLREIWAVV